MRLTWPNPPAPAKAGIGCLLAIEHCWPGLAEPERSAAHIAMKNITLLLTLIAGAFLFGCGTPTHRDFAGMPATAFAVTVSCSDASMRFEGTIISDGHSERLSGTGSGTFQATGHEIVCSFRKTSADGRISISVLEEAGKSLGSSTTAKPFGGVRAELLRTPSAEHTLFTTF